jgi:hypothetical protein
MKTARHLFALSVVCLIVGLAAPAQAADVQKPPINSLTGIGAPTLMPRGVVVNGTGVLVASYNSTKIQRYVPSGNTFTTDWAIEGPKTKLDQSFSLSTDAAGNVWVANHSQNAILSFAKGVTCCNPAPRLTISGSNTGLNQPTDVVVNPRREVVVVSAFEDELRIFPPDTGGDIEPRRTIDLPPGSYATGLAIDKSGYMYVTSQSHQAVYVYAPTASGSDAPVRTITGPLTQLAYPTKATIDSSGNLYVSNYGSNVNDRSVTVFSRGANGNVAPRTRLVGIATGLGGSSGIAVDANRNVYVVNDVPSLLKFSPLVPLAKPSAPRSVKVSGTSTASTRTVSWTAPASNGGTPITKYRVIIKKGTTTLYTKTTTSRSYKLLRSKLKSGTNKVYVYAINKIGSSPAATKTFTVKK